MHVITGLERGGAEGVLERLVTAKDGLPSSQPVVSLLSGGVHRPAIERAGVRVVDLGMRRGRISPLAVVRLARLIRRHRPRIVQTWLYHADLVGLAALLISGRWRSTRLIWGVRASDMVEAGSPASLRLLIRLCARLSGLPAAVIANSEAGRDAHRRYGYRASRFEVIHNGIDTAAFRPRPEARRRLLDRAGLDEGQTIVVHVARVAPKKDHKTLIAAARRLSDTVIIAIGDGTEALPRLPTLVGIGPDDAMPELLPGADIAVSCSAFGEGFSNAVGEAMAAGIPVVTTDVGDAALVVGDTGLIVPPRNPTALAEAIGTLVAMDPAERRALGMRARSRIEREFSLPVMLSRFADVYRAFDA
ncbi:MAG: glycosyltransferase [Azospirillaceae bacterium]